MERHERWLSVAKIKEGIPKPSLVKKMVVLNVAKPRPRVWGAAFKDVIHPLPLR